MPVPIGFDPDSGALVIMGHGTFPAKTLRASVSDILPDVIQIDDLAGRGEQIVSWSDVTSLDGSFIPKSMADALAYLTSEFGKGTSPVAGPRGPGILSGQGDPDLSLGITGDLYLDATTGDLYAKGD